MVSNDRKLISVVGDARMTQAKVSICRWSVIS
jgi:hypothetical protein